MLIPGIGICPSRGSGVAATLAGSIAPPKQPTE